jgi:hypothetical protein
MPDLHAFGEWLLSILLYVPQKIVEFLTDWLVSAIDTVMIFDFSGLGSNLAALPMATLFILGWFRIGTGLTIIAAAYGVRFLIRRIPFIG